MGGAAMENKTQATRSRPVIGDFRGLWKDKSWFSLQDQKGWKHHSLSLSTDIIALSIGVMKERQAYPLCFNGFSHQSTTLHDGITKEAAKKELLLDFLVSWLTINLI